MSVMMVIIDSPPRLVMIAVITDLRDNGYHDYGASRRLSLGLPEDRLPLR